MSEQVKGPFYLVHLEEDEPWLESIKQADFTYEYDRAHYSVAVIKQMPFSGGSTSLETEHGTAMTLDEVLQLPGGQKLIDDFMAGDTSVSDRQHLPVHAEQIRDDLQTHPEDDGDYLKSSLEEIEARLREVSA